MHFLALLLYGLFFLLSFQLNRIYGKEDISYNYIFDYITNVEVKLGEKEYSPLLNYTGYVETTPYILTDNQELIIVQLNINDANGLKTKLSILGIIIRRKGLIERIIVEDKAEDGTLNLLKGVVNILSIDEMRQNKTEADVNGECDVTYQFTKDDLLIKEKSGCNKTTFYSPIPDSLDSFSIYQDSKVKVHYQFNQDGALIAVNSVETHLLESVLSEELSQTFKSTTGLLLNKVIQSKSLISSDTLDTVVNDKFGKNYKDVFVVALPEIGHNDPIDEKQFLLQLKQIIISHNSEKRAQTTMELVTLLRHVTKRSLLKLIIDEKRTPDLIELVHDAFIGCSTKLCSEIIISELDRCLQEESTEASRMLLMMQHVSKSSEYMIRQLWARLPKLSDAVYDQMLQTISSMIERVANVEHLRTLVSEVVVHIKTKLTTCSDDQCVHVHLSAIRNTRLPQFRDNLASFLSSSGKYSHSVMAGVYNSICALDYIDESIRTDVRRSIFEIVKREINFYVDDRLKYEAIFCLVRLESNIDDIVYILNHLQTGSNHLKVFLASKLKELISMGIISDKQTVFDSKFYRQQRHQMLTYRDDSKMLVNQLMSTRSLYSDIHFNVIGQDGGVIRNSMTDIFLVSTARENHLLSLATHLNGLQSVAGSVSGSSDEVVEGFLQLILFGKEARPIQLFQGTSELMSTLWYAPTTLQSLLSGTFIPIDLQRELVFQNGVVLSLKYSGSTFIDFSFKLNSNLWYKTADSLLRVTGQSYISFATNIKSISTSVNHTQTLSMTSALDFDTNIDFSGSQVKNCLSVSRSLSQINATTVSHKFKKHLHSNLLAEVQGLCYSLSSISNQICSSF